MAVLEFKTSEPEKSCSICKNRNVNPFSPPCNTCLWEDRDNVVQDVIIDGEIVRVRKVTDRIAKTVRFEEVDYDPPEDYA